jgi:hypothetical protein
MGFGERKGCDHQNEIGLRLEVARVVPGRMRRCGDHAAGGSIASLTVVGPVTIFLFAGPTTYKREATFED